MATATANRPLWFIDNLARVLADGETTGCALDLVEVEARGGDMPPLHVHHDADETFYVQRHHRRGRVVLRAARRAARLPRRVPAGADARRRHAVGIRRLRA